MKALRVLTGTHAGAQVRLTSGTYRIGAAEHADVCISDWTVEDIELCVGEDGVARIRSANGDEVLVADFVAVPFGDVVFCVGPDGEAWPRDLDLLAGLWKTAEPPADTATAADADSGAPDRDPAHADEPGAGRAPTASPQVRWRTAVLALACTAAIGGIAVAGVMFAGTQSSEAASVKFDADAIARQLQEALHREGLGDLQAMARKDSVAVRGIVTSSDESAKAQRIMDSLARGKVRREYDVAQQDVDNIQQSLAGTGAAVSYQGHGIFRVSGNVQSMTTFRTLIAGIRADLGDNVKRVDVDVKEAQALTPDVEYTSVIATGGLRYIETPDGTKHLFASSRDEANN
ncbi:MULTISPECIES: HrpD5 family protein [Burkholderia]|uniref:HrpD5 family protein n=1 Tax=Burkholderia TaxID=32008 RepID=UPI0006794152|nr:MULTISPECIES: HrpD5 family protein [Burkholderia]KWU25238.1 secretion protein SctD [Burkholderia cenocepacia]QVN11159.1 secretion protein SctD [Burkholderia sp. LAS2]